MNRHRRILVVEDDAALRELAANYLRQEGYTVDVAQDGLDALVRIDAQPPDLVLTDIRMPELDGLKLAEALRHRSETSTIPVICITASESPRDFAASVNLGVRRYLQKPFSRAELVGKVAAVLGVGADV